MTTPTPGQPLSEADVSLLQGDLLLCPIWGVVRFDRFDDSQRRAFVLDLKNNQVRLMIPAKMTFLGRPDQDGWIAWSGGENPVPGQMVDVRHRSFDMLREPPFHRPHEVWAEPADEQRWTHLGDNGDIIAYRPHAPVSRPGDGVEGAVGGWLIRESDDGWLWTGTRIAAVAALTEGRPVWSLARNGYEPTAEPVSRPAGEGEREAVALSDLRTIYAWLIGLSTNPDLNDVVADGGVTVGMCYQQEAREFAGRIDRALSLLSPAAPDAGGGFTVDELAQEIRRVDGNHDLGAGALAEALTPFIVMKLIAYGNRAALQPGGER